MLMKSRYLQYKLLSCCQCSVLPKWSGPLLKEKSRSLHPDLILWLSANSFICEKEDENHEVSEKERKGEKKSWTSKAQRSTTNAPMKNAATSLPKYSWTEALCQTAVQRNVRRQSPTPSNGSCNETLTQSLLQHSAKEQILSSFKQKKKAFNFMFIYGLQDEPKSVFVNIWATGSVPTG